MTIGSKEHFEILEQFEKNFSHCRLDRETDVQSIKKGYLYQSGETNNLYQAYILGYTFGRLQYLN